MLCFLFPREWSICVIWQSAVLDIWSCEFSSRQDLHIQAKCSCCQIFFNFHYVLREVLVACSSSAATASTVSPLEIYTLKKHKAQSKLFLFKYFSQLRQSLLLKESLGFDFVLTTEKAKVNNMSENVSDLSQRKLPLDCLDFNKCF